MYTNHRMNKAESSIQSLISSQKELQPYQDLYPRFQRVRESVFSSLISPQTPDLNRTIDAISWSGVDKGITDVKGQIENRVNDISVALTVSGVLVDHQPRVEIDKQGQWYVTSLPQLDLSVAGSYISKDRKRGFVEIHIEENHIQYEAYWLETNDANARLEQVVDSKGVIHNFDDLDGLPYNTFATRIPGSRYELPLYKKLATQPHNE